MKIERALFLALTGTLSAACMVVEHPKPPPPPPPLPAATTPGAPLKPLQASNLPPHGGPVRHEVIEPMRPPPGGGGIKPIPAPPAPAPTPAPPAPTPPPGPAPQPPTACLDSGTATLPACTVKCASNPFMAQRCATYAADFDPKVAASAIACMNGLTGAAACDSTQAYGCGKTALQQACADSNTVGAICQIATSPCKVAQNDCVTMLSGLSAPGQDAVAQCVAKGCSAGLYSCIEGLSSSTQASH